MPRLPSPEKCFHVASLLKDICGALPGGRSPPQPLRDAAQLPRRPLPGHIPSAAARLPRPLLLGSLPTMCLRVDRPGGFEAS